MRKLAILHFNAVELYPPAMNLLKCMGGVTDWKVRAFTLRQQARASGRDDDSRRPFAAGSDHVEVLRYGAAGRKGAAAYLNYLKHYAGTLLQLIRWRPEVVLYYETLSAPTVYFYKRFLNRRVRVFIHYHEYTSPGEYAEAGPLVRWAHGKEKWLYPQAEWISHTNEDRIRMFREDMKGIALPALHSFPNYPPASWSVGGPAGAGGRAEKHPGTPLRLVYAGALSMDTMYTRELAGWVAGQHGAVTWDIYSGNITPEARAFLREQDGSLIRLHDAVDYYELPVVMAGYDVGVILYNGHIPNYIYNAPNKLFEYLACGLDIWFPAVMKGCLAFVTSGTYPRISAVDFGKMDELSWKELTIRSGLQYLPGKFVCEVEFDILIQSLRTSHEQPQQSKGVLD